MTFWQEIKKLWWWFLLLVVGFVTLMLSGCLPPASSQYVRTDHYDVMSNHTGYSIQEGNRIDHYDIYSNHTGYDWAD